MAFNLFKKTGEAPPDVGQEEAYEEKKKKEGLKKVNFHIKHHEKSESDSSDEKIKTGFKSVHSENSRDNTLEFEKINARIESINSLVKVLNERFASINQQIGELRAMNIGNEKSISKATQEAMKSVDLVREVRPERLRIDYQKIDMRVNTLSEKIDADKQFSETIMSELKDLRRKAGIFVGTDALLKLNEDVKKDLIELQKLNARVRINTDKSEEIFVQLKKGFLEDQKLSQVVTNLDTSYSGLQKEVQKLKLNYSEIVKQEDFNDFKKSTESKIAVVQNSLAKLDKVSDENEMIGDLVESILSIEKRNEGDIANIAMTIGEDRVKKVSDYDERLASILGIIEEMAVEINRIKSKVGMKSKKSNASRTIENIKSEKKEIENKFSEEKSSAENVSAEKAVAERDALEKKLIEKEFAGEAGGAGEKEKTEEKEIKEEKEKTEEKKEKKEVRAEKKEIFKAKKTGKKINKHSFKLRHKSKEKHVPLKNKPIIKKSLISHQNSKLTKNENRFKEAAKKCSILSKQGKMKYSDCMRIELAKGSNKIKIRHEVKNRERFEKAVRKCSILARKGRMGYRECMRKELRRKK